MVDIGQWVFYETCFQAEQLQTKNSRTVRGGRDGIEVDDALTHPPHSRECHSILDHEMMNVWWDIEREREGREEERERERQESNVKMLDI